MVFDVLLLSPLINKLVVALVVFHIFVQWFCFTQLKRPPGPFPVWPLVGNLFLLGKIPHQDLHKLSKTYGDIMELKLGSVHVVIISSPQMAKHVLQTHDHLLAHRPKAIISQSISYGGLTMAFSSQGDYWRRLRMIHASELLNAKSLRASKNVRDEEISSLVHDYFQDCKEGKPMDIYTRSRNASFNVMTRLLFGKRYLGSGLSIKECEEFSDIINEETSILGVFNISDFVPLLKPFDLQGIIPRLNKIRLKVDQFFDKIIQNHSREESSNRSKDFLDVMFSFNESYGFGKRHGDNVIKAVINEILEASTDTSITAIEWVLAELLKHPKFMKKAQDELDDVIGQDRVVDESDIPQLKYLQAIVKETFRLHPPAPLMVPHQNMEACEIGGYHILPKTQIFVNLWAIHRHSSTYENPLEFNPDRFLQTNVDLKGKHFELLPFGSGRRICPGMSLGLLIVQMQLARLLHSFTWKLPKGENPQDMDMGEVFGMTTRKAIPLRAIAIARLPQHLYLAPQFT
ncbi:unnamed protein product [Sphagnum troendelagicum]|uniref:Cytochrome P450 n=1 Tax=Sphagnum troendelagicum TaxID=128251 RepID=A0ABP0U6J9_9BRYO